MGKKEFQISVRNLIELVLRQGDLDSSFAGNSRMMEGIQAHQKIQKAAAEGYEAEVALRLPVTYGEFIYVLEGRADGVFLEEGLQYIDEIKSVTCSLDRVEEDFSSLHWAQAMCYAYLYCTLNSLEEMGVQLTYVQLLTGEIKRFRKRFPYKELEEYLLSLLQRYQPWTAWMSLWEDRRNTSAALLKFPYPSFRKGQKEMMKLVYKTITDGCKFFAQAPTGIGKTISTLFPSVKAVGEGRLSKIFYVTARTTTRQAAEDAFLLMEEKGLAFKTITLTAKEKICPNQNFDCSPGACSYACGHYDRINEALLAMLTQENRMTKELIITYAEKFRVCPFEYSLDLCLWADCIICDYNYVFDPRVYLKRFFMNPKEPYAFLIDEAHNLVDRARDMFSAELTKAPFLKLKKGMKIQNEELYRLLSQFNTCFIGLKKQCMSDGKGYLIDNGLPEELCGLCKSFIRKADGWLRENHHSEMYKEVLELYFNLNGFLKIAELYDERYTTVFDNPEKDMRVKLFCLDPSRLLREAARRGKASVFFSATLTPLSYFRKILGGDESDRNLRLASPFPRDNLCLLLADRVSTKYRNRESSFEPIAGYIQSLICRKTGNYMVFFPSFLYLRQVVERFSQLQPDVDLLVQSPSMGEEERAKFLQRFVSKPVRTLVGFGVLGGVFSEGIDLKGDRLIGAVIVGVGLPQLSLEQNLISQYFNEKNASGYAYAYQYPGMNKVLQAAGRVIRSEEDRGVVLLMDERFSQEDYLNLFPEEWQEYIEVQDSRLLGKKVQSFWRQWI